LAFRRNRVQTVWRLIKSRFAASAFDGEGARRYGSRWSSKGVAVAFAADSPALAVLEVLVHLQNTEVLQSFSLVSADVPEELIEPLAPRDLPDNWRDSPPPAEAQAVGDAWVATMRSAALRVPSVVLEQGHIYLLNPAHPDFRKIKVKPPVPFRFDQRLRH
jgi:RES domain-containing protein